MENLGTGAGLAALGFWLFVGAVVVGGIWGNIRKRDAKHETLRRVVESGQPLDPELTDKLLDVSSGSEELDRDLKVGGLIMMGVAPGLVLFGWIMSISVEPKLFMVMLSVGSLVFCIALGLLFAAHVVARQMRKDEPRLHKLPEV